MHRDAAAAAVAVDRDVVGFAHRRLGEGDREGAGAQVEALAQRLDVDDDVGVRERPADRGLDPVGDPVAGDQRLVGGGADRRVGEVVAAGLAQAQLAQLDVVAEVPDRRFGLRLRLQRRRVHEDQRVLVDQARGGGEDDRGDDQRGDRVALLEAERDGGDAAEDGDRARHVAGEVEGVGAQRRGLVLLRAAEADRDAAEVDHEGDARSPRRRTSAGRSRSRRRSRGGRSPRSRRRRHRRRGSPPRRAPRGSPPAGARRGARGRADGRRGGSRAASGSPRRRRRSTRSRPRPAPTSRSRARSRASARRGGPRRRSRPVPSGSGRAGCSIRSPREPMGRRAHRATRPSPARSVRPAPVRI